MTPTVPRAWVDRAPPGPDGDRDVDVWLEIENPGPAIASPTLRVAWADARGREAGVQTIAGAAIRAGRGIYRFSGRQGAADAKRRHVVTALSLVVDTATRVAGPRVGVEG